ncbi:hypothetical protein FDECE_7477 [Fusarium decemcellulare]|nr:hypothetical protein FDECE_7477 [Fusarium decemcellulare]
MARQGMARRREAGSFQTATTGSDGKGDKRNGRCSLEQPTTTGGQGRSGNQRVRSARLESAVQTAVQYSPVQRSAANEPRQGKTDRKHTHNNVGSSINKTRPWMGPPSSIDEGSKNEDGHGRAERGILLKGFKGVRLRRTGGKNEEKGMRENEARVMSELLDE